MNASTKVPKSDISGAQIRGARGLLGLSQDDLASASKVAKRTLIRIENGDTAARSATLAAIRSALEAAGVEFIAENGGGAGVRLRKAD